MTDLKHLSVFAQVGGDSEFEKNRTLRELIPVKSGGCILMSLSDKFQLWKCLTC